MSQVSELMEHYREVRARLRTPANAVADIGIDLHRPSPHVTPLFNPRHTPISPRHTPKPPPTAEAPKILAPKVIKYPTVIPFRRTDLTFSSVLELVADDFNISLHEIRTRRGHKKAALPRQVAIWITYQQKIQNLSGMGRYLKMDHTTIIHGRERIDEMMVHDAALRQRILLLEEKLLAAFHRTPIPTNR